MKAIVKFQSGIGQVALREMPEPEPKYDQVKIRVQAASICSADVRYYSSTDMDSRLKMPIIIGHEGSGVVESVGDGIKHVKPGDRVISETTFSACGTCEYCTSAQYVHCHSRKALGSSVDGFFADYVLAWGQSVHVLPDNLSFEEGALLEPLTCAVHAVIEQADVRAHQTVLVSGPGAIGLFAAQVARLCGATVILAGTTRSEPRLRLAKELGIHYTINSQKEDIAQRIQEITGGKGVDAAFECAGVESSIQACLHALKRRGTYVWMGVLHNESGTIPLRYNYLLGDQELKVTASRSTTPSAWNKALKIAAEGKVQIKPLISFVYPFEQYEEGFKKCLSREAIKVVLKP